MYMAAKRAKVLPADEDLRFCYGMLNRVSRSFAVVIQQLPTELRDAICVFYLVLRALDTVEDDMSLSNDIKIPLLRCFHEKTYDRLVVACFLPADTIRDLNVCTEANPQWVFGF